MKDIDLYLLGEMPETDKKEFEDRFLEDEQLFYEITERENELVDRYAAGQLDADGLIRFEKSLESNPARRQKVANAKLLREFIVEHREEAKTITIAERSGFLNRFAELFRMPVLQLASAGLIVAFALWSTYLLVENRRLRSLEQELASAKTRQSELESRIENEQEASGELAAELSSERDRVKTLEEEVANLKQGNGRTPPEANIPQPTIATLVLSTAVGRGGPELVPRLELPPTATRVSLVIQLDESAERVDVRLNGGSLTKGLRVRTRNGDKFVSITVPIASVKDGANSVEILDPAGRVIAEREFSMVRK